MKQVMAILNQKGGVGKTTTTISLAAYLAKAGRSVLVVDFDPQGNATSGLGVNKQAVDLTVYDVVVGRAEIGKAIVETATVGVNLVPANAHLAAAEMELVERDDRELQLKQALTNLNYDFVLIDCPPALGLLSINALAAANWLIIPVQAEYYALEGLTQLLDVVQRVRQGINPKLELLGVAVTMYDQRTTLAEQVHREIEKYFGEKVFKTIIPRNVRLAEAPSHGKPISEHDKWSKGARAYKALTKEVTERVK